ncbi:16S rRNA (cytidine(1402)-2'-O)-methyltransferase [candidate division WOR-3 bacterium]|nr:16S rRNA (cytidine(1402)-2'-O)-methyltransferase [candidate division WOR-3 bacterium]
MERLNLQAGGIAPGLYIVSTPIGNLADMTHRAVDVLKSVDLIACEDTRHSGLLLQHYHIRNRLTSYHEYNKVSRTPELVEQLRQGRSIALITDAGTPGISDPGFYLIRAAVREGLPVIPVPGASALLAGLVVSGLPSDRFAFEGFLPKRDGRRRKRLAALKDEERTTVYCESARRVKRLLEEMHELWGDRDVVVCRELTKRFEEVLRGKISGVLAHIGDRELKGETVVVVAGAEEVEDERDDEAART